MAANVWSWFCAWISHTNLIKIDKIRSSPAHDDDDAFLAVGVGEVEDVLLVVHNLVIDNQGW